MSNPVFEKEGGEKGGKARVWQEIKFWLALLPISCSQETKQHTIRDLKRFKVRKIKTLTSYFDLDFEEKPYLERKQFSLILNHFWSCIEGIPWWIFDMGRIGEDLWKKNVRKMPKSNITGQKPLWCTGTG